MPGVSRKSDILLKTPPRGFKGVFRCAGVLSAGRAPRPPKTPPPPMNYIVSGTSEQLGMRPRCDPAIRTAPTNVYGDGRCHRVGRRGHRTRPAGA